jgi:hypothetical protein
MEQHQIKTVSDTSVRRKIPISLSIVSYFFFAIGVFAVIFGFAGAVDAKSNSPITSLVLGVLYIFLSRGLRRCSRGWHIFGLIVISCALALTVILTVHFFFTPAFHRKNAYLPFLTLCFIILMEIWMLRVLTRLDIRRLFYESNKSVFK